MNDPQSRKWLLTINSADEKGVTHDVIKDKLKNFKSLIYWCLSDEIGNEKERFHTHVFLNFGSGVRASTINNQFPSEIAHRDICNGTAQQNKDYVFKEGKWEKDKKGETNLRESHEEYGEMPVERQGSRNDIHDLYDMIKSGMQNFEIIETNPEYMLLIDKIERARQIMRDNQFKNTFRQLEVTYIYGSTGTGKTRGIMEQYGYENVYRVTDYDHPFDSYKGQDVIVFEEFRSSLKIQDMLNYLDGYPLELPCRYNNRIACFTKVYIITNIALLDQYTTVQEGHRETWKAFMRRIHTVKYFSKEGNIDIIDLKGLREQAKD